jgi:gentisate 1,2-dioxygenase
MRRRSLHGSATPGSTAAAGSRRVGANQMKAAPHCWHWQEIGPYLGRIAEIARDADVPPIEFAERQQFLLVNPGLGGRLQVASTIRCAVSIYNPGDVAPVHLHSPNASRTILSEEAAIRRSRASAAVLRAVI